LTKISAIEQAPPGKVDRCVDQQSTRPEVQMSPKNRANAILDTARRAAAQLKPAARRAKPLVKSTGAAARKQVLRTRAWAAPQVERSGQALRDTVAPKVSGVLSSAARKLDPAQPRHRRWRKPAGLATLTAAGGAATAFIRNRMRNGHLATASDQADTVHPTPPDGQQGGAVSTDAE
jgi:hypothetical protein